MINDEEKTKEAKISMSQCLSDELKKRLLANVMKEEESVSDDYAYGISSNEVEMAKFLIFEEHKTLLEMYIAYVNREL